MGTRRRKNISKRRFRKTKKRSKGRRKIRKSLKNKRKIKKRGKRRYKISQRVVRIKASGKCPKRKPFLDNENIRIGKCTNVYNPRTKQYMPYDMLVGTKCSIDKPFKDANNNCSNTLNLDIKSILDSKNRWNRGKSYESKRMKVNGVLFDVVVVKKGTYLWRGSSVRTPLDINNFYGNFNNKKFEFLPSGILWFGDRQTGLGYAKDTKYTHNKYVHFYRLKKDITLFDMDSIYNVWTSRSIMIENPDNHVEYLRSKISESKDIIYNLEKDSNYTSKKLDIENGDWNKKIKFRGGKRIFNKTLRKSVSVGPLEYYMNQLKETERRLIDVKNQISTYKHVYIQNLPKKTLSSVELDGRTLFFRINYPMLGENFYDLEDDNFEDFNDFKSRVSINRESVEEPDAKALSVLLEFGFNGWIYFGEDNKGNIHKGTQNFHQEMVMKDSDNVVDYMFSYPVSFGELKESIQE